MTAFYNENDPKAAAWLRELIAQGHLSPGIVDERSITEISPHELTQYTQCHFFAGIGGWSRALRLAGWPDDRPVWTGSCPCQPFSAAGKGAGTADPRHLWPALFRLIRECRPDTLFGEQVASPAALAWFDGVCSDLESEGYAATAFDLCSASAGEIGEGWVRRGDGITREPMLIGNPNIRQRIYWVADAGHAERRPWVEPRNPEGWQLLRSQGQEMPVESGERGETGRVANAEGQGRSGMVAKQSAGLGERSRSGREGAVGGVVNPRQPGDGELQRGGQHGQQPQDGGAGGLGEPDSGGWSPGQSSAAPLGHRDSVEPASDDGRLVHPQQPRLEGHPRHEPDRNQPGRVNPSPAGPVAEAGGACLPTAGSTFWSGFDILPCTDGKARRVESGTFPLAHGVPGRVGLLRGYGNAINPWVAKEFIEAYVDALKPTP